MTQILHLQDIANHASCRGDGELPKKEVVGSDDNFRVADDSPRTSFAFQDHLWTMNRSEWSLAISTDALEKESQKRHAPSRSSRPPDECANEREATISR